MGSTTPTQATATMAATPATSATLASATPSTASTPTSSTSAPIDDAPHAATLRDIFTRLHSKAATDQALIDLYTFTRNNPTVSIEPYLARTSTIFRGYIQRGLQRIEKEQMTPRGVNVRAVTATPAATATTTATTPVTATATTPSSSEDPTSVTSNYRERLKQLQSKARSMTAESSASTVTPVSTSTPGTVAPVTAATAPVPQARATPSLDEIRARFRSAKVEPGQENKHVALPTHPNQNTTTNGDVTKPNGAATAVPTPSTTTAPLSASVSSLDSIRARIAIMKQK